MTFACPGRSTALAIMVAAASALAVILARTVTKLAIPKDCLHPPEPEVAMPSTGDSAPRETQRSARPTQRHDCATGKRAVFSDQIGTGAPSRVAFRVLALAEPHPAHASQNTHPSWRPSIGLSPVGRSSCRSFRPGSPADLATWFHPSRARAARPGKSDPGLSGSL